MVVLTLSLFQYFIVYSLIKLINYTSHKFDLNLKRYEYYQNKNEKYKITIILIIIIDMEILNLPVDGS